MFGEHPEYTAMPVSLRSVVNLLFDVLGLDVAVLEACRNNHRFKRAGACRDRCSIQLSFFLVEIIFNIASHHDS